MSLIYWERELEQPTVPFDVHFLLEVTLKTTKKCVEKKISRLTTRQMQQEEGSLRTSLSSPSPARFLRYFYVDATCNICLGHSGEA